MLDKTPRFATNLAILIASTLISSCSTHEMKSGNSTPPANAALEASSSEADSHEDEAAIESVQVSGAFLVECGIAVAQDTPHPVPDELVWIGCGTVDKDAQRPASRPKIVQIVVAYVDGSLETPTLTPPVTDLAWDVIATLSTKKPGGITKLLIKLEQEVMPATAKIVGMDNPRYKNFAKLDPSTKDTTPKSPAALEEEMKKAEAEAEKSGGILSALFRGDIF